MKRNKKRLEVNMILANYGITLVALIITIIIIIILATVTLNFTFGDDGIITKANQAKYMTQFSMFQEELGLYKANKQLSEEGFSAESITAGEENLSYVTAEGVITEGTIYDVIPSLKGSSLEGKMEIIKGELLINSQDMEEIRVAQSMGIEINPYIIVDGELKSDGANLALMDSTGTLTIPDGVTKIGEGAFADLSGLKTIIIPGTVKEIGSNAFRNNADLETVILQEGVEVIEAWAFAYCSKLKNIELPESLTEIGNATFYYDSNLDNVTIPSKITKISNHTFSLCGNLTNIELPDGLQTIDINAFSSCSNLKEIYIPISVTSIKGNSFYNCRSLINIEVASGNQNYRYDKASGMLFKSDGTEIVFIANAVLIGINTLTIPEGITSFSIDISTYTNITKIIIPVSLDTIENARIFPTTISDMQIAEENNYFTVENECLYNKDKTTLIMCFTKEEEVKLAESLKTINMYAFRQAGNIVNVNLPDSVIRINSYVFGANNTKLKNINIGLNVTYIEPLFKYYNDYGTVTIDEKNQNYTIENNELYNKEKTELITVLHEINGQYVVKEEVTKIGNYAFHYRTNMTSIILPEELKEIGDAFNYCNGLTTIYIPNSVDTITSYAFLNSPNLTQIQIDKEPGSIAGSPWGAIRGDRIVEWLR